MLDKNLPSVHNAAMPAPLLTVTEVAAHYRVKESTVYRWQRKGLIRSVTVGGTVRFPADVLETTTPEDAA